MSFPAFVLQISLQAGKNGGGGQAPYSYRRRSVRISWLCVEGRDNVIVGWDELNRRIHTNLKWLPSEI